MNEEVKKNKGIAYKIGYALYAIPNSCARALVGSGKSVKNGLLSGFREAKQDQRKKKQLEL